ncbi:methyltransferase-like protein 27 [Amphiura filiformis]|uniref:methyltransferase-like protein 27 n=1 Tax=Amphiura filiformis TaxID=82378 RepID=UPI003B21CE96
MYNNCCFVMADKIRAVKERSFPHTVEGIKQFYDEWAPTYVKDLTHEGYTAPRRAAETMAKLLSNKHTEIMDMACGTGLVAHELTQVGFNTIDGVDISTESLTISQERGIYRRLICDHIGANELDIKDDSYDGLILCGALGSGHLNLECFPELIRIVKPSGPIIFSVSCKTRDTFDQFKDGNFEADLDELVRKGLWVKEAYELIPDWIFNEAGHQYVYKVV